MALPAGYSRCGDTRLRRRWPASHRASPIQIGAEGGGGIAGESERISSAQTRPLEIAAPAAKLSGVIQIEMSGARIRVDRAWIW